MTTTEVLGTRVGTGYKQRFADMCEKAGATPREVIENLVDDYFEYKFEITGGHIAAESSESAVNNGFFDDSDIDYGYFGLDTFIKLLRNKKEYPDEYIKKMVDNMIATAYDMPKFNPKRRGSDWDC